MCNPTLFYRTNVKLNFDKSENIYYTETNKTSIYFQHASMRLVMTPTLQNLSVNHLTYLKRYLRIEQTAMVFYGRHKTIRHIVAKNNRPFLPQTYNVIHILSSCR